jgi:hypothetical protein
MRVAACERMWRQSPRSVEKSVRLFADSAKTQDDGQQRRFFSRNEPPGATAQVKPRRSSGRSFSPSNPGGLFLAQNQQEKQQNR